MDELTNRLDRLERSNRMLKGAVAMLSLAFVGLVAVGWTSPDGTVEAREFILKSADGKQRAVLGVNADGSPGLVLIDANEKTRAALIVGPDGAPFLSLYDADGKVRESLGVEANGSPYLGLCDADGKIIWTAPTK